jgi:hypothetical protein
MNHHSVRLPRRAGLFAAAAFLGLSLTQAYSIEVAGDLLVDLDAANFTSGGTTWNNAGTLGGIFNASPTAPVPFQKQNFDGAGGVVFDGNPNYYFSGPASNASIEGNQDRSIEMWVWDTGGLQEEESLLSWGHRRGGDGTNQSLNLGVNAAWGAVGHWGPADIGWDSRNIPTKPARGMWHHLVHTYDGAGNTAIYVDGVLKNSENINGFGGLNTHVGNNIVLGAQTFDAGGAVEIDAGLALSAAVGRVRVHSGALTPAQIASNYNQERVAFKSGVAAPLQLSGVPVHRYTMNGLASGTPGTVVPDTGSKAGPVTNAFIRGGGAVATPTGVDLPGGDSHFQAYIDLPNGIMSGNLDGAPHTSVTLETWVTIQSTQFWSRYMDFGVTNIGEVFDAGGDFVADQYVTVTANSGNDPNSHLEHVRSRDPDNRVNINKPNTLTIGQEVHVVMVYDAVLQEWRWYKDGVIQDWMGDNTGPATVNDVNSWLGRSNWSGDGNTDAIYNEFRVYDYALTPNQVLGNTQAGPDVVNAVPEPGSAALLLAGAGALGLRRRRKPAR